MEGKEYEKTNIKLTIDSTLVTVADRQGYLLLNTEVEEL